MAKPTPVQLTVLRKLAKGGRLCQHRHSSQYWYPLAEGFGAEAVRPPTHSVNLLIMRGLLRRLPSYASAPEIVLTEAGRAALAAAEGGAK